MIDIENLWLGYILHNEKSTSLKEYIINRFHRRNYVKVKKEQFWALKDLSLKVNEKERLAIIGRNGAGKSTLLKIISGILKPTKGSIHVNGTVQPLIEIAAGFNPEFTGRENIYLNGYMLGFQRSDLIEKEQEIIDFAELGQFIDVPVKYYSTGMSVRLAFTIATSVKPEILVFDEMLSAGDAAFVEKAKRRMNSLIDHAKGVILVSHDLHLVETFATRALVLNSGVVIFDGNPKEAVKFYLEKCCGASEVSP